MPQGTTGPTQFTCIVCNRTISRADVLWAHKAEQFDEGMCICSECKPRWETEINPPDLEHIENKEKHESFIAHYLHHAHDIRMEHLREKKIDKAEHDLAAFIMSSHDDPPLRAILVAIAELPTLKREALLITLMAQLKEKCAPNELLIVLQDLKTDHGATHVKELLNKQ